jgi:recombination DNA repair RAD52 pathway protein
MSEEVLIADAELEKEIEAIEKEETKKIPLLVEQGIVADEGRAKFLAQKTPPGAIYQRKGKAGQTWKFIKGPYVIKVLNTVFGFQWDFSLTPIKEGEVFYMTSKQVMVFGTLIIRDTKGNPRIIKTATGKKDIAFMKKETGYDEKVSTNIPLDLGNDIKAAETDALKRCARLLGIGLDLYEDDEGRHD